MKSLTFFLLLFFSFSICKAQSDTDHLKPQNGIFGVFDYQFDYYSNIRKILFKDLSDKPEIRFLVMPSFTPESVLDIQKNYETGYYSLIYRIGDNMIWSNNTLEKMSVTEYKKEIDSKSAQIIKSLFLKAIARTRHYEEDIMGLDGTYYHFFAWDNGLRAGMIWSPDGPKMRKLIDIGNELINLAKDNETQVSFDQEFIKKIEELNKELD